MKTTIDCFPCFMKQAVFTTRLAADAAGLQEFILRKAAKALHEFDLNISPPENAVLFYKLIADLAGCEDPFHQLKQKSTELGLQLKDDFRKLLAKSDNPLLMAVKLAMAGNIIDYGAHHDFDPQQIIQECFAVEPVINDFKSLHCDLQKAENILYLADNCGEIVFDGLLIEQLGSQKNITVAVKEGVIINDATYSDALESDLPGTCRIITNGTQCPGTPLKNCSDTFKKLFNGADLIISKGQGNFETLSESDAPIYFLLTVKCDVVAQHISGKSKNRTNQRVKTGDLVLLQNPT